MNGCGAGCLPDQSFFSMYYSAALCHWGTSLERNNYPSMNNRINFICYAKYCYQMMKGAVAAINEDLIVQLKYEKILPILNKIRESIIFIFNITTCMKQRKKILKNISSQNDPNSKIRFHK